MALLPFALPPSMGQESAVRRAHDLEAHLGQVLSREVVVRVAGSYQALERDLLSGAVVAAWGPPFVCARAEAYGGRGLVRSIRRGRATYRGALVGLAARGLSLENGGLRVAWVDRDSMGGYLLAQAILRERGMRSYEVFSEERFAGSYRAAIDDVISGRADVTAVWMASTGARRVSALTEILGDQASAWEVLAESKESPNDGVVLSPRADPEVAQALEQVFLSLDQDDAGQAILAEVFTAERFEPAPAGSYKALYELVFAALPG